MRYSGKEIVTAASTEPVTLTEVKDQLRITTSDDDTPLGILITAARQWVESVIDRALVTQTWKIYYGGFDDDTIEIPMPPLQSVTHVKYYDTGDTVATVSSLNYDTDTSGTVGVIRLKYGQSWPTATLRPTKAVEVQQVCGYGAASAVPETINQAIILRVKQIYDLPDPQVDSAIRALLAPYTVYL